LITEISDLRRELADLSDELPRGDTTEELQKEKQKKLLDAKERTKEIIKEKSDLEREINKCETLIEIYTDKISSASDKIYKLKEQLDDIENKVSEYHTLKYKEAEVVTNRLN